MKNLSLRDVDRVVNSEIYLKGINLEFKAGQRYILLGRTLAGKTSLLRVLAGLDRPTSGKIHVGDEDVTGLSVRKRNVAMVYQQFINYPSMTVFDNIASPLKINKTPKDEIRDRVHEAAKMLHIDGLLDRIPSELSGGQQQRTAIARALVKEADLLLLDEPLVNLDYKLREELRDELKDIFRKRDSVVVYTTTEPAEALMIGGEIVILDEGRILQQGKTSEVFRTPQSVTVSQVFSDPPVNLIEGAIQNGKVHLGSHSLQVNGHLKALEDGEYIFGIRPNHLYLQQKQPDNIQLSVTVDLVEINGSESFIHTVFEDAPVVIQEDGIHSRPGGTVLDVFIPPEEIIVFNRSGELAAAPS